MNQLTTIAALPSGAGQAAHLNPEIGHARKEESPEDYLFSLGGIVATSAVNNGQPFVTFGLADDVVFCDECQTCSTCLKTGCLPVIDPDMLDAAG